MSSTAIGKRVESRDAVLAIMSYIKTCARIARETGSRLLLLKGIRALRGSRTFQTLTKEQQLAALGYACGRYDALSNDGDVSACALDTVAQRRALLIELIPGAGTELDHE